MRIAERNFQNEYTRHWEIRVRAENEYTCHWKIRVRAQNEYFEVYSSLGCKRLKHLRQCALHARSEIRLTLAVDEHGFRPLACAVNFVIDSYRDFSQNFVLHQRYVFADCGPHVAYYLK